MLFIRHQNISQIRVIFQNFMNSHKGIFHAIRGNTSIKTTSGTFLIKYYETVLELITKLPNGKCGTKTRTMALSVFQIFRQNKRHYFGKLRYHRTLRLNVVGFFYATDKV